MMHPYFKNNNFNQNFFEGVVPLKPKVYTIVVIYLNGYKKEYYGIDKPWQYINKVKTNPRVRTAYIKD